jgi:hypothetical protein
MADEYFPGGEDQSGSTLEGPGGPPPAKPEDTDEDEGAETALMPKSMFAGAKPGDVISVRVKRVFEEEVEVEPDTGEESTPGPEEAPMDAAMGQMDRMGKPA